MYLDNIEKLLVQGIFNSETGYFEAKANGPFEQNVIQVAVITESLNSSGESSANRKWAFRKSMYLGSEEFKMFETLKIGISFLN